MVNVLSSEIVYDCGRSLNPAVDIGQIEGGFVMGLGYFLQEKMEYDSNGLLESIGSWEYKPPLAQDIPALFNITLISDSPNAAGILRSKAVGEPCIILSNSVYFATKKAIMGARADAGCTSFCDLDIPMTVDVRQKASMVSPDRFIMPR
jgi:xanthine dehydrogenase/oxidase